jgi:hypothetical protein
MSSPTSNNFSDTCSHCSDGGRYSHVGEPLEDLENTGDLERLRGDGDLRDGRAGGDRAFFESRLPRDDDRRRYSRDRVLRRGGGVGDRRLFPFPLALTLSLRFSTRTKLISILDPSNTAPCRCEYTFAASLWLANSTSTRPRGIFIHKTVSGMMIFSITPSGSIRLSKCSLVTLQLRFSIRMTSLPWGSDSPPTVI